MCGGTVNVQWPGTQIAGLSPRVRGNLSYIVDYIDRNGSIPACAGEPAIGTPRGGTATVYPRVCGGTVRVSSG